MSVILHASDTHFGTERPEVIEALRRLSTQHKLSLLILSGDITQRARARQFSAARRFVDRLRIPHVLAIPGNHDIPLYNLFARVAAPYKGYCEVFGHDLEPVFQSADLMVVGVRTTRRYRHIQGEVSRRQQQQVAERLRQARRGQLRIVVTHQPVHVTREEDRKNLLRGHEQAVAGWLDAGADLILGGHIHLPFIAPLSSPGAQADAQAGNGSRGWAVQAGTALSTRLRSGINNSVNLIRYAAQDPSACQVERWDFDDSTAAFVCVDSQTLERNPAQR